MHIDCTERPMLEKSDNPLTEVKRDVVINQISSEESLVYTLREIKMISDDKLDDVISQLPFAQCCPMERRQFGHL